MTCVGYMDFREFYGLERTDSFATQPSYMNANEWTKLSQIYA